MYKKWNQGMTLLEVIIAMAILGLILGAFFEAYTTGYSWVYDAGVRTQDDFTAQDALDNALGYNGSVPAVSETMSIEVNGVEYEIPGLRLTSGPFIAFRPD